MHDEISPPASDIPPNRPKSLIGVNGASISSDRQIMRMRLVQIIGLILCAMVKRRACRVLLLLLFDL